MNTNRELWSLYRLQTSVPSFRRFDGLACNSTVSLGHQSRRPASVAPLNLTCYVFQYHFYFLAYVVHMAMRHKAERKTKLEMLTDLHVLPCSWIRRSFFFFVSRLSPCPHECAPRYRLNGLHNLVITSRWIWALIPWNATENKDFVKKKKR
jgi:hypothetical protein